MKRDYIEFQELSQPVGYLITIRCYGTWLHGDERGSMDRRIYNVFGEPRRPPNIHLERSDLEFAKAKPMILRAIHRKVVEEAIIEVCEHRHIRLAAIHVRTNHAHTVVVWNRPPEPLMTSFKHTQHVN